ncbi:MAG: Na/Pi cotransporter family protein [Desulfitobacteriaceae bacterium]
MLINLLTIITGFILLFWGMYTLRQGLQLFATSQLQQLLRRITATPQRGFVSGIFITALLQSSTALTLMTVSFVDAGLLPYDNALGLILGSNIGSTITNQLLAFPLERFAPLIFSLGALGFLFLPNRWRFLALALSGLGILFFALAFLQNGLSPLVNLELTQKFLRNLGDNHLQGVLIGTLLSALLHSSSATTGLAMIISQEGWINLPTVLAIIFGANIGTCFTAVLASLTSSRAAQRVALYHVLLNIFGVVLFYPFLDPLANLLQLFSSSPARQAANAHTFFNLFSSLLAFPLLPQATRLLIKLLP